MRPPIKPSRGVCSRRVFMIMSGCAYDHEDNPIYYVDDDGLLRALAERRDRKFFEENLGSPASDKDGKPSRRAQSSI